MNPYLKIKNDYKAALQRAAKCDTPALRVFVSLFEDIDADAAAAAERSLPIYQKNWSELTSEDFEALNSTRLGNIFKESNWERLSRILRVLTEGILGIRRIMPIILDVIFPLTQVMELILQHGAIDECCDSVVNEHITPSEVFESLSDIDESIAELLIRRIDDISPATREHLLTSYAAKDKEAFCSALNGDCNISEIEKYFSMEMIQLMTSRDDNTIPEDDKYSEGIVLEELLTYNPTNITAKEFMLNIAILSDLLPDYLEIYNLLPLYLDTARVFLSERSLTEEERGAIESILSHPEVVDLYNERKVAYEKKKHEEQMWQSIKESNQIPSSKHRGAPRQSWMTNSGYTEEQARDKIHSYVWPDLEKTLRNLKYPESLSAGENKEKAIRALGAAIILYSAQNVGLADPEKKYSSSLERTLNFLPAPASTVKNYYQMMSEYENVSEYNHNRQTEKAMEEITLYAEIDSLRADILMKNYHLIAPLVERTGENLRKAFNL